MGGNRVFTSGGCPPLSTAFLCRGCPLLADWGVGAESRVEDRVRPALRRMRGTPLRTDLCKRLVARAH